MEKRKAKYLQGSHEQLKRKMKEDYMDEFLINGNDHHNDNEG